MVLKLLEDRVKFALEWWWGRESETKEQRKEEGNRRAQRWRRTRIDSIPAVARDGEEFRARFPNLSRVSRKLRVWAFGAEPRGVLRVGRETKEGEERLKLTSKSKSRASVLLSDSDREG